MQLAAAGGFARKQGLKQLHGGRGDDGGVPVFCGQHFAVLCGVRAFGKEIFRAAVVLNDVFRAEDFFKRIGVLVDDGRVRRGVDDAAHAVLHGSGQRKCHGSGRFSATRRHGKRINTRCGGAAGGLARIQNSAALSVELGFGRIPRCDVRFQTVEQRRERIVVAARGKCAVHKGFGVDEIGINKARKQHADIKREPKPGVEFSHVKGLDRRQSDFGFPIVIRFEVAF